MRESIQILYYFMHFTFISYRKVGGAKTPVSSSPPSAPQSRIGASPHMANLITP